MSGNRSLVADVPSVDLGIVYSANKLKTIPTVEDAYTIGWKEQQDGIKLPLPFAEELLALLVRAVEVLATDATQGLLTANTIGTLREGIEAAQAQLKQGSTVVPLVPIPGPYSALEGVCSALEGSELSSEQLCSIVGLVKELASLMQGKTPSKATCAPAAGPPPFPLCSH